MSEETKPDAAASEKPPVTSDKAGSDQSADAKRKKLVAGVAFGIGSAAIVAALLYAGRIRPKGKS